MHISNSSLERWLKFSWRMLSVCYLWCPIVALVFMIGDVMVPKNSFASKAAIGLVGAAVGCLFVVTGGWFALFGISLFYRRVKKTKIQALCGLLAGLLFGGFCIWVGVIGFLKCLQ